MKANKLLAIAAFASVICLATACGSTENSTASVAVNESKETEIQGEEGSADKMQAGWLGSFDERVEYVRNGYPIWLPEITYADAYENFYANPKWRAFDSTENKEIVEFSGECTYDGDPAEVYIQFELDNDDTFTFSYCSLAQNDKKLELDPSIIIQFLYNPFEAYSRDVLDKEIDSDTQSMMFDAYMELLAEYEAMNEDASTQEQISVENSANELLANDVVGTYEGGDDECIVVKSVTSAGIVVDTMMLNEGGVGGRTICTNIELPYMEGNINQVKFGDDGNISFSDGSIQVSVNGYADTFRKTSNDIEILAECQNESSAEKTESSGNDSGRYIWPDLLDDPGSFMCSWSSDELITEDEMVELDYYGARIVLNEIYARHGRKFKDQELQEHFDSKIWYSGTIEPENFSDSMLNEVEKQNAKILKNFMERHAN